jgi:hypothetical protein
MTKTDATSTMTARDQAPLPLGRIRLTPGVQHALTTKDVFSALARHTRGDWGDIGWIAAKANALALREGQRVISTYRSKSGVQFHVLTTSNRSETGVFLPEEV